MRARLRSMLQRHEGFREKPYPDTTGNWTVGFGHNCSAHGDLHLFVNGISRGAAEVLFDEDLRKTEINVVAGFHWFEKLDPVRQDVILDMAYNLGVQPLSLFYHMIEFIEKGQYFAAADQALKSVWATQVGDRAIELAMMLESGEYQDIT